MIHTFESAFVRPRREKFGLNPEPRDLSRPKTQEHAYPFLRSLSLIYFFSTHTFFSYSLGPADEWEPYSVFRTEIIIVGLILLPDWLDPNFG